MIKYFFCYKFKDYILFNFFSLRQIKLYIYNPDKIDFTLKKTKDYSSDIFQKFFYYMEKSKRIVIFRYNALIVCDNTLSSLTDLLELEETHDSEIDTICSCKELSNNLLCVIFNYSISLYNLELDKDKLIGSIQDIYPKSVKMMNRKDQKYIIIISESKIYIYDFKNLNFIQKLETDVITNIKKIKCLHNSDIAIIYGDYNLAIYDLSHNFIKFKIINETNYNHIMKTYYFLKSLDEFTLLYNPSRFSLHAINYIKGDTLAKFSDGHNRIIRCKKIHSINIDNINEEEKIKYYYIINIKGYFILTIKK